MTFAEMYNMHPKKTAKPADKNNDGTTTYTEKLDIPVYTSEDEKQPELPKQELDPSLDKDGDGVVSFIELPGTPEYQKPDQSLDKNEDGTVTYTESLNIPVTSNGTDGVDANADGTVSYAEAAGIPEPETAEEETETNPEEETNPTEPTEEQTEP